MTAPAGFIDTLPVYDYYDQITEAVDRNQVTIITAETGAGKSTQVPQYLAEHGYQKVIVTQPRILAARNLMSRVRDEWALRTHQDSTPIVGYRTAHERDDSADDKILYCTDGLQLVREITGSGISSKQVLVLDEVHEWNENMEVLVAWAKKRCHEQPRFKVVIMSATIESASLAQYFNTTAVINVPGRTHPVTKRRGTDVISEILGQITQKRNILVFLPGKAEIQDTADAIKAKAAAATVPVIPLHSQLEAEAQQQAFAGYPNGKVILATNIAQTSVTIDDIDVVIDSGLERRSEVQGGVEGLFIAQTSQADCLQRAGRAGRTKAGKYILAPYDTMPCLDFDKRPPYGTPEILRKHIDRLTLRLASVGIDVEVLDFYHDPSANAIKRAKQTLIALGAMTPSGEVTRIGTLMERFPVESSYGRMLVEAQQYSPEIIAKLAVIIGIQEVGGIVRGGTRYTGWRAYTKQTLSDLLAQYDVFLALESIAPDDYEDLGIIAKNVDKATDVLQRLENDLQLTGAPLTPITNEEQMLLCRCIVAGQIDQIWSVDHAGIATHIATRDQRELSSNTVVRNPRLITGTPFDLQIPTRSGGLETLKLVEGVTGVNADWLSELAPQSFKVRRGKVAFDPQTGRLAVRQTLQFGKHTMEAGGGAVPKEVSADRTLFATLYADWAYSELERERRALSKFGRRVPAVPLKRLQQQVKVVAGSVSSLDQLSSNERLQLLNLARLETHLGSALMRQLTARNGRSNGEHHRRGWRPGHKRRPDR
jgi:HrpA-like RNA helicase